METELAKRKFSSFFFVFVLNPFNKSSTLQSRPILASRKGLYLGLIANRAWLSRVLFLQSLYYCKIRAELEPYVVVLSAFVVCEGVCEMSAAIPNKDTYTSTVHVLCMYAPMLDCL